MADNLIFPIRFDLESGVQDAIKKGDVALRQIQAAMNRKPIVLRAEVDANKFQMFSRQFTNSIDGISAKLTQAQRIWNSMSFDVKFDPDGNLSRRAQIVFDAFQQLTQASATMGQRLGEVNRNLAKSEQETAHAITAEYEKRQRQVNEQIRLKERQAAAEERMRQGQLKGVNVGYVETQRQVEAVRNLRLQYEAILPMLNAMAQRRYDIKVGIDKQFEADIQRINAEVARLRQSNLQLGAKGDTNAIQANLQAIRQLEAELQRISQQKIDLLNSNKINSDLARLRTEISSVFGELQSAERRLASDNSLNAALDAQSQKVLKLHADIQKLDQQFAQLNATGKAYNQDGSFTAQANTLLQQRIALTKQLEQEAITGQQAQIKLEQQLREEKRQTEQAAKNAAKEAERQAKAEVAARKQAQDAANAENKVRQEAYNARRRQGQETQRILNKEAKSIADITAKLQIQQQRLQSANIGSAKFNKIAEEVRRLTADLEKANQKMRELTGQTQSGAARQSAAVRQVSNEFKNQETYVSRLLKRMAVYASFSYAGNFLTSIREVTAQFELQRVSLGAIIQDQQRANQLFEEIKTFALKSPVKILDLTKYTKQLAAYKIGVDELFDTTKRLTDVSVGLGVSMDRVVLAYGQVRARGALYSSEIRQFTEMGVPIVEELAAKLTKMNGELVTSAQVLDLVQKGAISFEMVKEVFDDMTSAGGAFFNMQERQGNTLFGMWQKLGDAASVMYDEIGNTDFVNGQMKGTIAILTDLMKNWRYVANAMMMAVPTLLLVHNIEKSRAAASARQIAAMNTLTAATSKRIVAEKALTQAIASGLANTAAKARMNLILAQTEEKVAQKALTAGNSIGLLGKRFNVFGGALKSLSTFVATNFWTILLTGIALLTSALVSANEKANRLKNTLAEIGASGSLELSQSVQNFERLAKIVVESADGSKKQRDALDELHRTYKEMIPVQDMTIEKLRAMNGDYRKLTIAIEEYIRARLKQQQIDAVTSEIGADLAKYERKMTEDAQGFFYTYDKGTTKLKLTYDQIQLLIKGIKEIAKTERDLPTRKVFAKALTDYVGLDAKNLEVGLDEWLNTFDDGLFGIVRSVRQFEGEIDRIKANETLDTTLGKYAESWKRVNERIENLTVKGAKVGTFTFDRATANASVKQYVGYLKEVLGNAWDESFASIEEHVGANGENMSSIYWDAMMKNWDTYTVAQQNAILKVQKAYDGLLPSDRTVVILREKLQQISGQFGVNMDITKQYLMNAGEDIETYAKRVKSSLEEAQNNLKELRFNKTQIETGVGVGVLKPVSDDEIEKADNLTKVLAALFKLISGFTKTSGSGRTSDPRLQNLKEEISLTKKLYDEYHKLEKQIGATKAAEKIQEIYSNTIKTLQDRATAYKFDFKLPFTDENLKANMQHFIDKMKELQKLRDKKGKPLFPNIGKEIDEAVAQLEDIDLNSLQKALEKKLKELSDRISRTKTAKEFYEKILEQTGDINIATRVSMSIYGSTGEELFNDTVEQIREAFKTGSEEHPIDLDISAAIDLENQRIDYKKLADIYDKYQDEIIEKRRDTAKKIATEGQKEVATDILNWRKSLAKAKSYEQKRTDIINTAAAERARIIRETTDPKERGELLGLSYSKQAQELAKLAVDEFKSSDDYIKVFQNLDRVSTQTLDRMKKRLEEMIATVKDTENVEGLKTLVEQLDKIKEERETRNPIEGIIDSFKEYAKARKDYRIAESEEAAAKAEFAQQEAGLNQAIQTAKAEQAIAQQRVNDLKAQGKENTSEGVAAELALNEATKKVTQATENRNKAVKKVNNAEQKTTDALDAQKAALAKLQKNVNAMANAFNSAASSIKTIADMMGIAEDSELGDIVNGLVSGLNNAATIMTTILAIAIAIEAACWWMLAIGAAVAAFSAIGSWLTGSKVRKANKEIERQQKLLDQLEYTYGRLEKAADKVFGADYVDNQKQRQKILLAQQQAYMKQYEAEMSKGKKADEEKAQEFLDKARDIGDQIADMQGKIAEQMLGTDLTSAARDFAKAWLDAYKQFGNTADAMSEKFHEMIENMIVESLMAKAMQRALEPAFKMIDEMDEGDFYSEDFWRKVMETADQGSKDANAAGAVIMEWAKKWGYDGREKAEGFTGIAKSVAGATSEEINNVAAIGNTLLYYASPIPRIDENLARVVALMEGRGAALSVASGVTSGAVDYTDLFNTANQHLSSLPRMEQHLAEIHTMLGRALRTKGSTTGFNTFLNS